MSKTENHNENFVEKMEIENDHVQQGQQKNQQMNQNQQIQFKQITEEEYQKYCQDVEQNSQRMINKVTNLSPNNQAIEQQIQPMKNPVSAYMVFTMRWKKDNPQKKFNMANLGQLWKNLQPHEKRQFEEEYRKQKEKYDLYIASKLISNPNNEKEIDLENKFFFPLHRIKSIMKQDTYYAPKTEAVAAMAKATQYFGQYFLQELKKIASGKNRIDTKDLFDCISANQKTFWFLECLIDDYAQTGKQKKQLKMVNDDFKNKEKEVMQQDMNEIERNSSEKKKPTKAQSTNNAKPLPKGQTKLTDMFGMSTKK